MIHTSFIEISESAVKNNLDFIRYLIGNKVILSSVVKGNAYGHGILTYCKLAYKYGVRHFCVSDAIEAYYVCKSISCTDISILIMGMIDNDDIEWAIQMDIEFYVFDMTRLRCAANVAKALKKKAKVHLEFETGMNRTGFVSRDVNKVLSFIHENSDCISVEGVCTHLAGAESIANYKRITDQQTRFKRIVEKLKGEFSQKPLLHMASSAATIRYPKTRYNLVRVGIMQYGFFPTKEIFVHYLGKNKTYENPLKRIVSWKTKVMDVKSVKAGKFIGYGTSYFSNSDMRIAVIPVGYSSGYSRTLSNKGKVLIHGVLVDIIGTINMNMMSVDITNVPGVKRGDEVVLIGRQGSQEITVSSFGDYSQTINYELLTRLPQDIPRIVVD